MIKNVSNIVFHSNVSTPSTGEMFPVHDYKTITVEIYGTSTSQTVLFEASGMAGTFYPIQGTKLNDLSIASQTTGLGELWQFDITGVTNFRTRISAVSGGSLFISGVAIQ